MVKGILTTRSKRVMLEAPGFGYWEMLAFE